MLFLFGSLPQVSAKKPETGVVLSSNDLALCSFHLSSRQWLQRCRGAEGEQWEQQPEAVQHTGCAGHKEPGPQ